ncbi:DNA topoisomerase [Thiovibrio sp. JS02]
MAKSVVIVETAAKAKTLEDQLGEEVEAILIQSPPARVSPLPAAEKLRRQVPRFAFALEPKEKSFWDRLISCQGREIYLGLDTDWRGEFWAWLINGYWATVGGGGEQLNRLGIAGLAGETLRDSFRRVEPMRDQRGAATYIRMLFDSYLGKHLQRLLGSRSGPSGLALNYLSLTTLFLLAERETEIRMYTPVSKWRLKVKVSTGRGESILGLEEAYGITDDSFLHNEKEVQAAISLFNNETFRLGESVATPFAVPPPAPYRLEDLLHDCVVQGGLKPLAAMVAIRNLCHGVVIGGRGHGLITAFLPVNHEAVAGLFPKIREQIGQRLGAGSLGPEQRYDEFAGMILPTLPELGPDELTGKLGEAEERVYRLVWSRSLASQMSEARGEVVQFSVEAGEDCLFSGSGKRLTDKGFLALYQGSNERELLTPCPLAEVAKGAELQCLQIIPEKNIGLPPEYFTFETLAGELAEFSLALDGITVAMLQQMLDCGYLRMMPDGSFRCAENAAKLITVMHKAFPSMKGIHFSAYLGQTIDEAATGRKPLAMALQQFEQTLLMRGEVLVKLAVPVTTQKRGISSRSIIRTQEEGAPDKAAPVEPPSPISAGARPEEAPAPAAVVPGEAVRQEEMVVAISEGAAALPSAEEASAGSEAEPAPPVAGSEEVSVSGREGEERTLAVEAPEFGEAQIPQSENAAVEAIFAEAPTSIAEVAAVEEAREEPGQVREIPPAGVPGKPCPDCGRPLLLKEDRFGRFWYCSGHPECRHSESYGKEGGAEMLCPLCGTGNVVTKHTPTGKLFYVCPEQDCEFMAWARPHSIPCPACDSPFLVEKMALSGKAILRCPRAGCNYMQPLAGGTAEVAAAPAQSPRKKVLVRRVGGVAGGATRKVRIVRKKK